MSSIFQYTNAKFILILLLFFVTNSYAKSFDEKLCENKDYTCYTIKHGDTWEKILPDQTERDVVKRINRMNIEPSAGHKIALPTSPKNNLLTFSPFQRQIDPPGTKTIIVSLTELAFGAYDTRGVLQQWGPISSAKGYCPDIGRSCTTPIGKFVIYNKEGANCTSTKFPVGRGGAPMPYCMFFHGGFALHGSPNVPGFNDSHGCVRLFIEDAKWLNTNFTSDTKEITVIITSGDSKFLVSK